MNLRKADWPAFAATCDQILAREHRPFCVHKGEANFRRALIAAAKRHIPAGRIPNPRPNFPSEASRLDKEREELRARDPTSPRLAQLSARILATVKKTSKMLAGANTCAAAISRMLPDLGKLSDRWQNPVSLPTIRPYCFQEPMNTLPTPAANATASTACSHHAPRTVTQTSDHSYATFTKRPPPPLPLHPTPQLQPSETVNHQRRSARTALVRYT